MKELLTAYLLIFMIVCEEMMELDSGVRPKHWRVAAGLAEVLAYEGT